jgi:hypothetical protein
MKAAGGGSRSANWLWTEGFKSKKSDLQACVFSDLPVYQNWAEQESCGIRIPISSVDTARQRARRRLRAKGCARLGGCNEQ